MRTFSLVVMAGVAVAVAPLACSSSGDDLFPSSTATSTATASTATSMAGTGGASASTATSMAGTGGASASTATSMAGTGGASASTATSMAGTGGASASTATSTAGTGGASASTATSMAGTGGASASTSTTPEDCTNGVDDDANGLVDCADPACSAGFVCEGVPSPWRGPGILFEGPPGSSPSCPADYPMLAETGFTGVQGDDATCSDCGCDAPTSTCVPAPLELGVVGCAVSTASLTQSTSCAPFPSSLKNASAAEPTVNTAGTSCAVTGGDATLPLVDYATEAIVCAQPPALGGGCGPTEACAPRPPAPFESTLCVVRDGNHNCPNDYPNKHSYVTSWNDDRGCSACVCGDLDPAACSAVTSIYSDASCSNESDSFDDDGSCNTLDDATPPVAFDVALDLEEASCDVTGGGDPIGGVTPATSITVCCQ